MAVNKAASILIAEGEASPWGLVGLAQGLGGERGGDAARTSFP